MVQDQTNGKGAQNAAPPGKPLEGRPPAVAERAGEHPLLAQAREQGVGGKPVVPAAAPEQPASGEKADEKKAAVNAPDEVIKHARKMAVGLLFSRDDGLQEKGRKILERIGTAEDFGAMLSPDSGMVAGIQDRQSLEGAHFNNLVAIVKAIAARDAPHVLAVCSEKADELLTEFWRNNVTYPLIAKITLVTKALLVMPTSPELLDIITKSLHTAKERGVCLPDLMIEPFIDILIKTGAPECVEILSLAANHAERRGLRDQQNRAIDAITNILGIDMS